MIKPSLNRIGRFGFGLRIKIWFAFRSKGRKSAEFGSSDCKYADVG